MTVELQLHCAGCDAKATSGPVPLARVFATLPEGWVLEDPYTGQTYCPLCWSLIMRPIEHKPECLWVRRSKIAMRIDETEDMSCDCGAYAAREAEHSR